jgi:hypothetical protein
VAPRDLTDRDDRRRELDALIADLAFARRVLA